ncbi:MAG TPA: DUF642 domain-containing protein [Candidatus Acidoferrales bacterium]|nr:DUF642 domain-containing protein [Candidatus Acidoferrales bacterium]
MSTDSLLRVITRLTGVAFLFFCALASPAHANQFIVNGSFEASSFGSPGSYTLGLVGNDVPGWFIPASDGTYPWGLTNGAFGASTPFGNQFFVLGEVGTGTDYTIQQTMTGLVVGDSYMLTFDIASEVGCCAVGQVSFLSGSSTSAQNFTALASGSYWTAWQGESMTFLATNSNVTLQFEDLAAQFPGGLDLGLDNVSVTGTSTSATPEPSSLLLLGTGLLGLGPFIRRFGHS